jgi:benzodiazapine receptor
MSFNSEYQPFFQPPGWVVRPVWILLYTTLIISIFLVYSRRDEIERFGFILTVFLAQLVINIAWPAVFNSEQYLISFSMILCMVTLSSLYSFLTWKSIPEASKLMLPYIAWVSFAGIINVAYYLKFRT